MLGACKGGQKKTKSRPLLFTYTTGQNLIITPDVSARIEIPPLCLEWGPEASKDVGVVPHP